MLWPGSSRVYGGRLTVSIICTVVERGVGRIGIMRNTECLPLCNVIVCYIGVVRCIGGITSKICDGGHGSNADDTLEGQIGLVPKCSFSACLP